MSVGLPGHLTPQALGAALSRAAHGMVAATLVCGVVICLGFAAAYPTLLIWPAILALVMMFPMMTVVRRSRRPAAGVAYLAVGAFAVYVYTLTFALQLSDVIGQTALWLAPPKIVLVLVAGAGFGLVRALTWTIGGYLVAEAASLLALSHAGMPPVIDLLTLGVLVEAVAVCILAFVSAGRAVRTQPRLQRAARDELLDDMRSRMELRAAALMHDTILSHLAAIASSSRDTLSDHQMEQIQRDLQILIGQEWLHGAAAVAAEATDDDRASPLRHAIADARADGLDVVGTGDFAAITRLNDEQAQALGLAAKQCLVNVIKHSGVMKAEVAVYSSEDEVSVMIIDAGRGFSDSSVGSDRLGLRASVQSRIQSVGGLVQVWSTPGAGTSILIQLPLGDSGRVTGPHTSGQHPVVSGPLPTVGDAASGASAGGEGSP